MNGMDEWDRFVELVEAAGMNARQCTRAHWQIDGPLLVNYWPFAKRGPTAHVRGTKSGRKSVTVEEAIEMAVSPPPNGGYCGKRDPRKCDYSKAKVRMLRKNNKCWVCGKTLTKQTATLDHVIPLSLGGLDNHANWKLACEPCNRYRGNKMPEVKKQA